MQFKTISAEETKKKILQLLEDAQGVWVASYGLNDYPDIRSMSVLEREGMDVFWFSTTSDAKKIREFRQNPRVAIYGMLPEGLFEFRLFGNITLHTDLELKKRFWDEKFRFCWPDGPESDDIMIVRFETIGGEYLEIGTTGSFWNDMERDEQ